MRTNLILFLLTFSFSVSLIAQDTDSDNHTITISIPEVALVDIEPAASKNLTINFTAPTEAGNSITPPSANTTLWLNYSSIKSVADATRTVSVSLDQTLAGVDVQLQAAAAAATGSGGGTLGTAASTLTLTTSAQTLISGIGSAYTGDGSSNGHNLTYSFVAPIGNYADLEQTSTALTVTYTISDN